MNRKDELKFIIEKARLELSELEANERLKGNQSFVGKFFKYRNCYSCPKEDEYWWLYIAINQVSDDGALLSWNFQKDIYGRIEIQEDRIYLPLDRYIEISEKEFREAYYNLIQEINVRSPKLSK